MYNTDLPRRADLPTSAQLKRSTWIAGASAAAILALVVLPAEYAVDPTGVGRLLGLTQMGAIKLQLAGEAAADAARPPVAASDPAVLDRLDRIEAMLQRVDAASSVGAAVEPMEAEQTIESAALAPLEEEMSSATPDTERFASAPEQADTVGWQDEMVIDLPPGEGAEVKLVMQQGAMADFQWSANGSAVNYETHGDGGGESISYEKGRAVPAQEGVIEAAFAGNHGWFWRNRTDAPLTLTLRTRGAYSEINRLR